MASGPRSETQARRAAALETALGPLAALLADERVVEILLNADGCVWVERAGEGMTRSAVWMAPTEAERLLRLVASEIRCELHTGRPSLAAKLPPPWALRVQAAIPPIVDAPVFAFRRPARMVFSIEDYVERGILGASQRDALMAAIEGHENVLIGGGTGSGKTTFANALLKLVARSTDRVHILEDTRELECEAPNRVQVLVQPPVHTWRDAVMAAMRFRPDRIVVGEVRDGSALELLKAWNTGHPGGLATIHANDTRAMLDRVCQLIEEVVYPAALGSYERRLRDALRPYTLEGAFGSIFDAADDDLRPGAWTMIEMGAHMALGESAVVPALEYLFHCVEGQFDGRPTLMIVDEAWLFLGHPVFAPRLQAWLKTLRKKNVYVVFATQEVADATRRPDLLSTILSACPTKIFLPDDEALTPMMSETYQRVGLTTAEVALLARAQKKRDYFVRSVRGRRLVQLDLGPAALAFVGMSSEADHRFLDEMMATCPEREYARAMLERRSVGWGVAEIRAWPR